MMVASFWVPAFYPLNQRVKVRELTEIRVWEQLLGELELRNQSTFDPIDIDS